MLREFHPGDLETCVCLLIEAYNGEPWNNHWTNETATRYLKEFVSNEKFVGFVICEKEVIVGAMFAHQKTWWTKDELFVDELFIAPRFQRKGYGEKLLAHAETYAQSEGLAGLTLLTNRYLPAKTFYTKHGYKPAEHIIFMYKQV
ncbi:MAG: GNAT family N-acetyltransferase [Chloroflexi bacterium]|nr:GNAT family N-acetyltransferase [Chloroflexota bacterium]